MTKATGRARERQGIGEEFVIPGGLRRRFETAAAADPLEFEQALLRIIIYPIVYGYVVVGLLWDGVIDDSDAAFVRALSLVYPLTMAILAWILARPGANATRRWAGIVLDLGSVTVGLLLTQQGGAVMYGIYLWVTIGNGFRFGLRYLYLSQLLAFAGFGVVLAANPFWRANPELGVSLFVVLAAIPAYLGVLVSRFHSASRRLSEARGEAEAANAAKTKLLAAASHDLRQPMQALSMYASVLEQRTPDEDTRRAVHGIQLSVTALEQMFDSLLDIARIESGVIQPGIVEFPLQPLVERVVRAEAPLAEQKALELRIARTGVSVRSDPALLERMLKNLVTNAVRYTERGGILVGCRRAGPGRVRLVVADTGVGIEPPEQARIFDEYYQIGGRSVQGLGLGLSIVKSLGDLLGHEVAVHSTPGRGSAFSIGLPRAAPARVPADAPDGAPRGLLGAAVAVVDDDAEIRRSLRLLLEGWDCRCYDGAGPAAVETQLRAAGAVPGALIVDFRLAGAADGLQAIARLRGAFGASIPALLITGTPLAAVLSEARLRNVAVAVKPVPPGKLRAFLEQAVRGRG